MLLFLFSEAIFFIFLLVAYINFHSGPGQGVMTHALNVQKTAVFTVILMASSFTLWRAHHHGLKQRFGQFHFWLSLTILLGLAFLYGQLSEYFKLFHQEITVSKDPLATAFFTVTGFHGLHVCIGVILLVMLLAWSLVENRKNKTIPRGSLEAISLYWHFVDLVWIGVFGIVYWWGTR
jgi:heme/copper-type cytochrome/quinol oxidase subunit 3